MGLVDKFATARQFNDDFDFLDPPIPHLIDTYILATPIRIYVGLAVSMWTIVVAIYLIFAPRWWSGKFAPRSAMITLDILTITFWFCAFIALALFAAEMEPICLVSDEVPIIKKIIEICILTKTATAFAALSWLFWLITCTTLVIQACVSRRSKRRAALSPSGQVEEKFNGEQGVSEGLLETQPLPNFSSEARKAESST